MAFTEENLQKAVDDDLGETTLSQYFELNKGNNSFTAHETNKALDTLNHDCDIDRCHEFFKWETRLPTHLD